MAKFKVISDFKPAGDQPAAIEQLVDGIESGKRCQVLMGVTGSGKTFTIANTVARVQKPTLVVCHNKTLAAQLYEEFKDIFPENAVGYFVSYYDYYQPEAYIPSRDIYIEKDASRNDDLERLRLHATTSLMSRSDTIIISSVSCIFGLGSPEEYKRMMVRVTEGEEIERNEMLLRFSHIHYERHDVEFLRGKFRVRGDVVEIWPAYDEMAIRIEMFGDEIERISRIHPVSGEVIEQLDDIFIYPAQHYVMPEEKVEEAIKSITEELEAQLIVLRSDGKLLEAQRLNARTRYDMEMIQEVGYCSGIENYARHLGGLAPGARPFTLIDYFPDDFLMVVDESHVTLPQIRAMYAGDQSRKGVLVNHGFRLPSALDNRPLRFEEVEKLWRSIVFVTATPADYELEQTGGEIVEQVIRPTGLVDPVIIVEPASGQVPHLLNEIKITVAKGQRVLVTALTKRLAEDLSHYIKEEGIKCAYLHSDILTIERVEILRHLRMGEYDVVVGVNLLREGLDLPEVSLVAILDADKEGFLRSKTSLIQTIGRAARNVDSRVFLYADKMTNSMQTAMDETERRRTIQTLHNEKHGITPQTIKKAIRSGLDKIVETQRKQHASGVLPDTEMLQTDELIGMLEKEMFEAAEALDFEKAATLRDQIEELSAAPVVGKMAKAPATQTRKQFKARMLKTNIRVNKKS